MTERETPQGGQGGLSSGFLDYTSASPPQNLWGAVSRSPSPGAATQAALDSAGGLFDISKYKGCAAHQQKTVLACDNCKAAIIGTIAIAIALQFEVEGDEDDEDEDDNASDASRDFASGAGSAAASPRHSFIAPSSTQTAAQAPVYSLCKYCNLNLHPPITYATLETVKTCPALNIVSSLARLKDKNPEKPEWLNGMGLTELLNPALSTDISDYYKNEFFKPLYPYIHQEFFKAQTVCGINGCPVNFTRLNSDKLIAAKSTHFFYSHVLKRQYPCPTCGAAFAQSGDLTKHRRRHTGKKPFTCTFDGCGKAYTTNGDLTRHLRTHTGEKPYKCTVDGCGAAFARNDVLTNHLRTHTGEKPFKCTFEGCKKAFSTSGHLRRHMRTHSQQVNLPLQQDGSLMCMFPDCNEVFNQTPGGEQEHQNHIRTHGLTPSYNPPTD